MTAAFSFDSGDSLAFFSQVVDGYLELLRPLLWTTGAAATPRGPYLRTLRDLPGPITDEFLSKELAQKILGDWPGAYPFLASATVDTGRNPTQIDWKVSVNVYVVSAFAGQVVEGRLRARAADPRHDPGLYTILTHACEHLHMAALPAPATGGQVRIERVKHLLLAPTHSAWVIETSANPRQVVSLDRTAPPLQQLQADHGVESKGDISSQKKPLLDF